MSLSLRFIFVKWEHSPGRILGYERLSLSHQDYELFDRIRAEATPIDGVLLSYEDEGIKDRSDDPYGTQLTFLTAHRLAKHFEGVEMEAWDAAVLAFVKALPPSTRIVLWWS